MSEALNPWRAIDCLSRLIFKYPCPDTFSILMSAAPLILPANFAASSALALRSLISSPNILTATSALTPVDSSATLAEIGCIMTICAPSNVFNLLWISWEMVS